MVLHAGARRETGPATALTMGRMPTMMGADGVPSRRIVVGALVHVQMEMQRMLQHNLNLGDWRAGRN